MKRHAAADHAANVDASGSQVEVFPTGYYA
jgi:hypothetical protein